MIAWLQYIGSPSLHRLNDNDRPPRRGLFRRTRFMYKQVAPICFIHEVLKTYFETSKDLSVSLCDPQNLAHFLHGDIFRCGFKVANVPLRALRIEYDIEYCIPVSIGKERLSSSLAPVLAPTFQVAHDFRLTIILDMGYSMKERSDFLGS